MGHEYKYRFSMDPSWDSTTYTKHRFVQKIPVHKKKIYIYLFIFILHIKDFLTTTIPPLHNQPVLNFLRGCAHANLDIGPWTRLVGGHRMHHHQKGPEGIGSAATVAHQKPLVIYGCFQN